MKKLTSHQIRSTFLSYFREQKHHIVESSSLVPHEDPTLLFTNAGMNQFKDTFLGLEQRNYVKAASSQKCVRAGGKHNDLENVGYTARHHTFFEMLGNFSFGDYFKEEAITYAWDLLTNIYQIPEEKLLVTIYADDEEAYKIWSNKIGLLDEKIIRIGDNKGTKYASDNFWMMGDTGPCGPCSEIFYDHGKGIKGGPPGSKDEDGDRFIEIWNLVFMQFNRDENGVMHPLPKPSVDTGMGLERITAILQSVHSNYEIDTFQVLIKNAASLTNTKDLNHPSLKVLADHIRATTYLINDGVIPSNEGRGYVLRRIIRRAIRHGYKLKVREPFFYKLVAVLNSTMGVAYPIKDSQSKKIESEIKMEEERFFETIENGMSSLEEEIKHITNKKLKLLSGEFAFKLHDTFGFPLDLTGDICREKNIIVNEDEFNASMNIQKSRAREAGKFKNKVSLDYSGKATIFVGYDRTESKAKVNATFKDDEIVTELKINEEGLVILDETPFYAESGGQVGDIGMLESKAGAFKVLDTYKIKEGVFGHWGKVISGTIKIDETIHANVNVKNRDDIKRNHSATHLLHKALKIILGDHVEQKGSLVSAVRTRFDFSHPKSLSLDEINQIEDIVNSEIMKNQNTETRLMDIKEAQEEGAMMLFGEKYGEKVRVLDIGNSRELCGGTHVQKTGDICLFKIQSESGISSGVRRIEATTGVNILNMLKEKNTVIESLSKRLNASPNEIITKTEQLLIQIKDSEKLIYQLRSKLASSEGDELLGQAIKIKSFSYLAKKLDNQGPNELREMIDNLKKKLKTAVIILASINEGKASFAVGVTDDLTSEVDAGEIAKFLGESVSGKGGGRKNMAMAGGTNISMIDTAMANVQKNLSK
ncbi:MAG: alanine--tRNA ligase [Methylophilaceae bacterium]|nr:alanine--tRNA ligase [Methylophilaceae bacterium]